ncbi:unnamed protein product [Larinioides sclopetarius]|uniref:Uncharacterized protein n=1 Tax=Larinioides sclopetarius TaxID=280406 RepID=A0AAV1YZG7_9ARAC
MPLQVALENENYHYKLDTLFMEQFMKIRSNHCSIFRYSEMMVKASQKGYYRLRFNSLIEKDRN